MASCRPSWADEEAADAPLGGELSSPDAGLPPPRPDFPRSQKALPQALGSAQDPRSALDPGPHFSGGSVSPQGDRQHLGWREV